MAIIYHQNETNTLTHRFTSTIFSCCAPASFWRWIKSLLFLRILTYSSIWGDVKTAWTPRLAWADWICTDVEIGGDWLAWLVFRVDVEIWDDEGIGSLKLRRRPMLETDRLSSWERLEPVHSDPDLSMPSPSDLSCDEVGIEVRFDWPIEYIVFLLWEDSLHDDWHAACASWQHWEI